MTPAIDPLAMTAPDLSDLQIEDDQPVDNIFSEKQQRLLSFGVRVAPN